MGKEKDSTKKTTARVTETIKTVILIPSQYIDTIPRKKSRLLYQQQGLINHVVTFKSTMSGEQVMSALYDAFSNVDTV